MRSVKAVRIILITASFFSAFVGVAEGAAISVSGSLGAVRRGHTATLLVNGEMLVVGGDTPQAARAEIYDPAVGTSRFTSSLNTPRWGHTATLLRSGPLAGHVLIVGGCAPGTTAALNSAELYDPATGLFTLTGSMSAGRVRHTATLLGSNVLIAGGRSDTGSSGSSRATTEIYSTSTESFRPGANFPGTVPREQHTATRLNATTVLLAGGVNGSTTLATAILYNALLDTFSTTGAMTRARKEHTATLLNSGDVLVTGGTDILTAEIYSSGGFLATRDQKAARSRHTATLLPSGKVLLLGGRSGYVLPGGAAGEMYDPALGTFAPTTSLATERVGHVAVLMPSSQVAIVGGNNPSSNEYLAYIELFDGNSPAYVQSGSFTTGSRYSHTATLLMNGQVLIAGGYGEEAYGWDGSAPTAKAETMDPETGDLTETVNEMSMRRYHHTATLLPSGEVLVAGGETEFAPLASCELYDPAARTFRAVACLDVPRSYHTATLLPSGKVLFAGGTTTGFVRPGLASAVTYDPLTGAVESAGTMSDARAAATATLLPSGRVLVAGGGTGYVSSVYLSSADLYDPATNSFVATGSLAIARQYHAATLLSSGRVLVTGGLNGRPEDRAEIYDPATGSFTPAGQMLSARGLHVAVRLFSGRVLLAGGANAPGGIPYGASELYDPATGSFVATPSVLWTRKKHTATLLFSGKVLVAGGDSSGGPGDPVGGYQVTTELFDEGLGFSARPLISWWPDTVDQATGFSILGSGFLGRMAGGPEASGGNAQGSPTDHPVLHIRRIDNEEIFDLSLDPASDVTATTLSTSDRWSVNPGPALAYLHVNGIPSPGVPIDIDCGVRIVNHPQDATVAIGNPAHFAVSAVAAYGYQWQEFVYVNEAWVWRDIIGATEATYQTAAVAGPDSGNRYRAVVKGNCEWIVSNSATLTIADAMVPQVTVVRPTGGEYWLLSPSDGSAPNTELVAWTMTDDVRICHVVVSLVHSNDGGTTFGPTPSGGGLPAVFGSAGDCLDPGEETKSVSYTVPTAFPSSQPGSLYKIRVEVADQAGKSATAESPNAFYIVQPNPDSVKTLILWNRSRITTKQGLSDAQANELARRLQELADHPRVLGIVVDLSSLTSLTDLLDKWDDPNDATNANEVLFGSGGLHEYLRTELLAAYGGVEYLVLVGDDRIIPMARIADRTWLLPESTYANGVDLSTASTVGQALAANQYLTDDPLAVLDPVNPAEIDGSLYLPDLAIGRLVETPQEIITTIATYIGQDGILDVSPSDVTNKVLVTGYDFLSNVAKQMRKRWKAALADPSGDGSTSPVDGTLLEGNWGLGSVTERADALRGKLSGNGGERFGIMALAGHATHYEEGVPGTDPFDIQGLSSSQINTLDLSGGVVYAVGCHGGLTVPGSTPAGDGPTLDLPQTMLGSGLVAYVANSGYGWSLKNGIGYGGRLVQIFTEEMTRGGSIPVGDAVKRSKQRYFLESPRYDAYDEKSLMQWTLFGLPMYVVKTGITEGTTTAMASSLEATAQTLGSVRVNRSVIASSPIAVKGEGRVGSTALPSSLTQLTLSFDFTAGGVYDKYDSQGTLLPPGPGCPDPNGCYHTLNGLVDRGTGSGDVPIQPYLVYDSRLAGTSQHGVLWKGGVYDEESGWKPIVAELISNGGDGSNHGAAPRTITMRPTAPRIVPGVDSPTCRPSDLELNSLTVAAGEAIKGPAGDYSIARRYRNIDLEVFYFNNRSVPAENCDRTGPELGAGPYHTVPTGGSSVTWRVPASDPAGVWRVVIVYTLNSVDSQSRGRWIPLELANDGSGTFTGAASAAGTALLTYVIQAVDHRGNVSWLEYTSAQIPSSGVALGVPNTVDAVLAGVVPPENVLASTTPSGAITVTWSAVSGASSYDVYRKSATTGYLKIGSSASASFSDTTVQAGRAYLYAVRALDGASNASLMSAPDLAATFAFTDATLTVGMTKIKAAHITELRAAVNAVRALAGQSAWPFTDPTLTPGSTIARGSHMTELRSAIDEARVALGLTAPAYGDPTITPGVSRIRAAHVEEIRTRVR